MATKLGCEVTTFDMQFCAHVCELKKYDRCTPDPRIGQDVCGSGKQSCFRLKLPYLGLICSLNDAGTYQCQSLADDSYSYLDYLLNEDYIF